MGRMYRKGWGALCARPLRRVLGFDYQIPPEMYVLNVSSTPVVLF